MCSTKAPFPSCVRGAVALVPPNLVFLCGPSRRLKRHLCQAALGGTPAARAAGPESRKGKEPPGSVGALLQPENPMLLLPKHEACPEGQAAQQLAPLTPDLEEQVVAAGGKLHREGSVRSHAPARPPPRPA